MKSIFSAWCRPPSRQLMSRFCRGSNAAGFPESPTRFRRFDVRLENTRRGDTPQAEGSQSLLSRNAEQECSSELFYRPEGPGRCGIVAGLPEGTQRDWGGPRTAGALILYFLKPGFSLSGLFLT